MKNLLNKYVLPLVALSLVATSCSDFLNEENQNGKYSTEVWDSPKFAEGVLLKGYQLINSEYFAVNHDKDDYVTSDMVTNVLTDDCVSIATGEWTSRKTTLSFYDKSYQAILHINDFIQHVDEVDFAPLSDQSVKDQYTKKLKGEAYGLRAWWYYQLLRAHAGKSASGDLLGVPIVKTPVIGEAAMIKRSSFADCVKFIVEDCEEAIKLLPATWTGSDRVEGDGNANRLNGTVARVIKSRVLLMAASKAFEESGYTFKEAAEASAKIMDLNSGITALDPKEMEFYSLGDDIDACTSIFWYTSRNENTTRETNHYAPSLYGKAVVNPSQNLVDCFPAANGYPISMATEANYNAAKPFENRDPRLKKYIYCDGDVMHSGAALDITAGQKDAPGGNVNSSRTGYYLRKLLNETSNLVAGSITKSVHHRTLARYSEVLLNFAEAANEIGPDENVGGYTAREVINALRTRAGITNTAYVDGLNQSGMRELIRNERRIELCFESFRWGDMRRWADLDAMNETVKGITKAADGSYTVNENLEIRDYKEYMIYGAIPYSETLKYDLVQNKDWE